LVVSGYTNDGIDAAATYVGHSHNGGTTWTFVYVVTHSFTMSHSALEISYHDSDCIWVSAREPAGGGSRIYRSTDGGHTFPTSLDTSACGGYLYSIHVPYPNNATDQTILIAGGNGVGKSTNGGASFTLLNGRPGLGAGVTAQFCSFECMYLNANRYSFFSWNDSALYISDDAGDAWTRRGLAVRPVNKGVGGRWVYDNNRFYLLRYSATTDPTDTILAVSFDGGVNWHSRTGNYFDIRAKWENGTRLIALWGV